MLDRRLFITGASTCVLGCMCRLPAGVAQDAGLTKLMVCTELVMPDVTLASSIARNENPRNSPVSAGNANAEALSLTEKRWHPQRRILNVDFLEAPPYLDRVISAASGWHASMGLRFQFGRGAPDILVSFTPGGSWSYIGTDSLHYARKGLPSMNFGWFDSATPDQEINRTTLHEFGHALSLIHEHLHLGATISWRKQQVYAYYKQQGWNATMVDRNIFMKYDVTQVNGSAYDRASIMHYPIPPELVQNPNDAVGLNVDLSPSDRQVIGVLYPPKGAGLPV